MAITSRQDLAEYCLRKLGGGVINIEVSADQLDDRVEDAIEYFTEYHFDGIMRDYFVHRITATELVVSDSSGFNPNDTLVCVDKNIRVSLNSINGNTLKLNYCHGPFGNPLAVGDVITNGTVSQTIDSITLGTADKGYVDVDDMVVGVMKVVNLSSVLSSGDYMFNAQYQIMMSEIHNLTSGGTQYLYGMMTYLGHLDYILRKEKDFRFNRRMNKVYVDVGWESELKIGDYMVLEVYRALDDSVYSEMLNDRWLKEYTTALIKLQWGQNVKKFQGMQLPGGLVYSGQQIFDEATKEIEILRDEAIGAGAPLEFIMG